MLKTSFVALLATTWLCSAACGPSTQARRYDRKQAQASLSRLESPGLVIGVLGLPANAVVDGDTIKVRGLDTSLRLLGIDTEETYKKDSDRRASDAGFNAYLAAKRGDRSRPAKAATPLGEEAKKFAERFLAGTTKVRLERDHPKEVRGRYNRYLTYVFVEKNGVWVNYNIEAVRAGMSPYFTKYGYSRRFHSEFVAAEKEAQAQQLGIWKPGCQCYPDYPERKSWWDRRADFILDFERKAANDESLIVLTHWDALRKLDTRIGEEVTVLATVGSLKIGDKGPSMALLSRRLLKDLPAVFFDRDVFAGSGVSKYKGEFVAITGVVNKYKNKYNHRETLQIIVNLPSQVSGSLLPDSARKTANGS